MKRSSGPCARKEERRRGEGYKYCNYFRERRRSEIFETPSCGAKIATGDNRFQNGLPSYRHPVCLSSFPSSSPHPPNPPSLTFPVAILLFFFPFHFIILCVSLMPASSIRKPHFLMCWCIDTRLVSTLNGLLTPTCSGSSRLSRHNSSPLHKGSKLRV